MKNKRIKVVSAALALTTVLGITAGIAINTSKQAESMGNISTNTQNIEALNGQGIETYDNSFNDFDEDQIIFDNELGSILSDNHNGVYNSVIEDANLNEYATYAVYQNIDGSHEIRSWGYNTYGLLGNGGSEDEVLGWAEATRVDLDLTGKTFKFIETLNDTVFVVLNNGESDEIWAWGNNDHGQLFIDEATPYVATPTRILEDKIPTWGSVVGIDASLGSTIVYYQGNEGEEFDPFAEYNNEDLWIYGAGDTSYGQDAKTTMFEAPLQIKDKKYIASDANDASFAMIFANADDNDTDDSRVVTWGDNSTGILGAGDTAQPEAGYALPVIHDEELEDGDVTKFSDVSAGTKNFYFITEIKQDGDWVKYLEYAPKKFVTGSKIIYDDFDGPFDGITYLDNQYESGYITSNGYRLNKISGGDDYYAQIVSSNHSDMSDWVDMYDSSIYTSSYGQDFYGQLGNGEDLGGIYRKSPLIVDGGGDVGAPLNYLDFDDETYFTPNSEYDIPNDIYVNYLTNKIILETNKHTTLISTSTDELSESNSSLIATGSNSNGIFNKYSDSNFSDQQSYVALSDQRLNYENIKFEVIEDSVTSSSAMFTIDTGSDSGLINPNSYQLDMWYEESGGNTISVDDNNLSLISVDGDGLSTWKLSGLTKNTNYNFKYLIYNDSSSFEKQDAFSITTTDSNAPAPELEYARLTEVTNENTQYPYSDGRTIYPVVDGMAGAEDVYNIAIDYKFNDVSNVTDPTSIEKIVITADKEDSTGIENSTIYDSSDSEQVKWELNEALEFDTYNEIYIEPETKFTNVKLELWANQEEEPITYDLEDYTSPSLRELDEVYTWQEVPFNMPAPTKDEINFNFYSGFMWLWIGEFDKGSPYVDADLEFTNLEFVSGTGLDETNFSYVNDDYWKSVGNTTVTLSGLEPGTSYNDLVLGMTYVDHMDSDKEYYYEVNVFDNSGLDLTTAEWGKPNTPEVTSFISKSNTATSADFDWTVEVEPVSSEDQSPVRINKVSVEDRVNGVSYDVTDDLVATDENNWWGESTIYGLSPETTYNFELKVEYSDMSGGHHSSIESKIITLTTGEYEEPLQPVIIKEEGIGGWTSITVNYDIELPSTIDNPNNEPTELTSVKLYLGSDTTPVDVSVPEDLVDSNGDGLISGSLEVDGLESMTEYTWHIEVESNAETVVGEEHTTTTQDLLEPTEPTISSYEITKTGEYDVFYFDYTLSSTPIDSTHSPAWVKSVEFIYNGEVIGYQPGMEDKNGQYIDPEIGLSGGFNVTGLPWNEAVDAELKVVYLDASQNEYTTNIDIIDLNTPEFNTVGIEPIVKAPKVATKGTFEQVSSTEALINYSVKTPAVTIGNAEVDVTEIRVMQGTNTLATTTVKSGNILLTNLTPGTEYSDLTLEVDYNYIRPENDANAGEILSEGETISKNIRTFTTLAADEFQLAGNVQYVGYANGNLEGTLSLFDSSNVFVPENFRVSVVEGTGESAQTVEKTVELTKVENSKSEKFEEGITTSEYKIIIKDIKEGVSYTSWKYTMSQMSVTEESDWHSFIIEDPITGNEFNTFYMPPTITNHNMRYIILDALLLLVVLGLVVVVIMKVTKKKDDDEEDETPVKKTKAVKGGNNE